MLLPSARRARLLGIVAVLCLVPLQFAVSEITGQDPYPALYLPGFHTARQGRIVTAWVPEVVVVDADGVRSEIDPYDDLLHRFPSAPTSALTNWFRAGLRSTGAPHGCREGSGGSRPGLLDRRCAGHSRTGVVVWQAVDTKQYLFNQVSRFVANPRALIITWREVSLEVGSGTEVGSQVRIRLLVALS